MEEGDSSGTPNSEGGTSQSLITRFIINGESGEIDNEAGTITLTLPYGTDLRRLRLTIEVSDNGTVNPASGEEEDFSNSVSNPVNYTVTAEDGETINTYVVTVINNPILSSTGLQSTERIGAGDIGRDVIITISNILDGEYNYRFGVWDNMTNEETITLTGASHNIDISGISVATWNTLADRELKLYVKNSLATNYDEFNTGITNDIQRMWHNLAGSYTLESDVDMRFIENFNPIGDRFSHFEGNLYGQGYIVENLTINRSGNDYIGFLVSNSVTNSYWVGYRNKWSKYKRRCTEVGINKVNGINTITDDGDGTYSAIGIDGITRVDIFVGNFGTDDDNPWVYVGDGQWPILYWQEET